MTVENTNLKKIENQQFYYDLLELANRYAQAGEYENAGVVVNFIIQYYPERILNLRDSLKNKNGGDPR